MLLRKVQAALLALKLSVHHHLSFVLFEGDSKTVIEVLRRSSPQIFLFLLSLQFWLLLKKCWDFYFIPRHIKSLYVDKPINISYLSDWVCSPFPLDLYILTYILKKKS